MKNIPKILIVGLILCSPGIASVQAHDGHKKDIVETAIYGSIFKTFICAIKEADLVEKKNKSYERAGIKIQHGQHHIPFSLFTVEKWGVKFRIKLKDAGKKLCAGSFQLFKTTALQRRRQGYIFYQDFYPPPFHCFGAYFICPRIIFCLFPFPNFYPLFKPLFF